MQFKIPRENFQKQLFQKKIPSNYIIYQELRAQEEEHGEVDEDSHHAAGLHRWDEGG